MRMRPEHCANADVTRPYIGARFGRACRTFGLSCVPVSGVKASQNPAMAWEIAYEADTPP